MARKLYPLGIHTFERIRKEDKLYIDKTGNITDWMTERLLSDVLWHEICLLLIQWLTSRPWDFLSGGNRSHYGDDRV